MPTARRTLILALLLVAAGSLAFATGATVLDGPADTFADDDLAVQPADGPNGNYAYLTDDDEIVVDVSPTNPNLPADFEGVNPDALASADGVFTITYTADEYARVWIDHPDETVTFTSDGESIEGEANNVTLAPNESVAVGLSIDTRDEVAGTQLGADEFSINATIADPETADIEDDSGSSGSLTGGGLTTTVTAPDANRREFVASDIGHGATVRFGADGMALDDEDVTLDGLDLEGVENERVELHAAGSRDPPDNGSALDAPTAPRSVAYLALEHDFEPDAVDGMTIRFSADRDRLNATDVDPADVTFYRQTDAGEWDEKPVAVVDDEAVESEGLPTDRVHFRATTEEFSTFAVAERVPRYDVTAATVEPAAIDPGDEVTVRATVANGGGAAGEETVTLTADGDPIANETVALAPNETATVELAAAVEAAGSYDLAVDGTPAGTLLVGDAGTDTSGDGDGDAQAGSSDDDGAATGDTATDDESIDDGPADDGPTEEPGGIGLAALGGLLALLVSVTAGVALFRRLPR
ncbi:hypothetical protein C461_01592 [Halorubrum aidingense JCM 13560]|uniref:CARDB domain-containing protein n=1 Tax=Halorubrum aidingense JCM 13560 TaxID=1230454 RepID=M0PJN2_9EURY|nr:CARDB domain-containing protein [Halorubrum aidingense]EMA70133.1 hypothetical protein C461_01592 [Halorubrum aidingense JCM 13560]